MHRINEEYKREVPPILANASAGGTLLLYPFPLLSILHCFHLTVIWKIPLSPYILKIVNRLLLHKQKDLQQRCFWL